jgi:MraZ protein
MGAWPLETTLLTGAYEYTIDAKNRLSIPAQIRNQLDVERDGTRFYLVPGARPGTLSIYPEKTFRRRHERRPNPEIPHEDLRDYTQVFYSMATLLEADKQGRVLLPERHLRLAGIGHDVYITGSGDHLDLWNRADYEKFADENWSRYAELQHRARKYFPESAAAGRAQDEDRS